MATNKPILTPTPSREEFQSNNLVSIPWVTWFNAVYSWFQLANLGVSADNGDASVSIVLNTSPRTVIFATALTATRTATLSSVNARSGAFFRVVRKASATGASPLNVVWNAVTLKALAVGTWCDVEFDGTDWILTAAGSL